MSENSVRYDDQVKTNDELTPVAGIIKIDEQRVLYHLGELVQLLVEDTLNELLGAEVD